MSDYERIAQAITFITRQVDRQPTLNEVAAHLHLSPFHFQRLFSRWAGVTPKRYLQVLTVERAKALLRDAKPLLEVADALGLSSGSRVYDHFVSLEAVTPGEYQQGGLGLNIEHAVHDTPFGMVFIAITRKGVCQLAFLDPNSHDDPLAELAQQWPAADLQENRKTTAAVITRMFAAGTGSPKPLPLHVSGTNFQIHVWKALLQIPAATLTSYSQLATAMGRPQSARAVGTAIGANPIALLIPCHRVIQQTGKLGGYHWGETRKQAINVWEMARAKD